MAQHDYVIANASGATVRADINNMALAISSNNSGSSAPGTTYAYLWWLDTSANVLKLRNSANNAWITMPFSVTANNTVDINGGTIDGTNIGASSAGTGAFTTLTATTFTSAGIDDNANATAITINSSEQVGIGRAPGEILDIKASSGDTRLRLEAVSGSDTEIKFFNDGSAQYTIGHDDGTDNFVIGLANVDEPKVSVNKSGNVGIATPNPQTTLDVTGTFAISNSTSSYWKFDRDDSDGRLKISDSSAEKFSIETDGKVGIGTTSPDVLLHLKSTSAHISQKIETTVSTGNAKLFLLGHSVGDSVLCFGDNDDADVGSIFYDHSSNYMSFTTNTAEAMRIDSSGRVKAQCLSGVGGFYLTEGTADAFSINSEGANGNLLFKDIYNSSERMRILANGNVGINTTNPGDKLSVCGSVRFNTTPNDGEEARHYFTVGGGADAATYTMYDGGQNAKVFFTGNGGSYFTGGNLGVGDDSPAYRLELPNTGSAAGQGRANAWVTYSDSRIKSNIQTLSYGLDIVKQLKPSQYKHHNSIKEDGQFVKQDEGANDIGFIAQEVLPLIPEVVSVPVDTDKDLYSISYQKLTAVLTKAIQEQQTIIEDLKTRIETLEG